MKGLFSIIGSPSPKLYAVMNIVRALVQVLIGEHVVVVANSLEALREKFPDKETRNGRPVVLFSDYPKPEILACFTTLRAPVAICIDDFATIAWFSVVSRGFGGVDAARFATMGLVNVEPTILAPPPLSLFVGDPNKETVADLVGKLAAFYSLPVKDDFVEKVLQFCGLAHQGKITLGEYMARTVAAPEQTATEGRAALEKRSPLERELIDFLAPQYDAIVQGRPIETLEWPVCALLQPEFPDRMTTGPIDLTGPARHIYYGPYFALPAGVWIADISFEVQDCYSDNQVAVDVCAAKVLSVVRTQLPPRGVYGCHIRFEVEDPSNPVEIRMQLLTGAIEGVIQLRAITLRRFDSLDEADEAS